MPSYRLSVNSVARLAVTAAALTLVGCGGGGGDADSASSKTTAEGSKTLRAAALSLQSAMASASGSIDGVRGTRDSLERLGASLQPTVAQTGDVIVLLTPTAAEDGVGSKLLTAAREQRSFLQFATNATTARTRSAGNSAIQRAKQAGARASDAYTQINQIEGTNLAGLLPTSTTFNTGRLRDAVRNVNKAKKPKSKPSSSGSSSSGGGGSPAPAGGSCGNGISVNSVTSCTFAANVRDAYQASGGDSVVYVYSPVTKQNYAMSCSGSGPVTCNGGNGAVVTFR